MSAPHGQMMTGTSAFSGGASPEACRATSKEPDVRGEPWVRNEEPHVRGGPPMTEEAAFRADRLGGPRPWQFWRSTRREMCARGGVEVGLQQHHVCNAFARAPVRPTHMHAVTRTHAHATQLAGVVSGLACVHIPCHPRPRTAMASAYEHQMRPTRPLPDPDTPELFRWVVAERCWRCGLCNKPGTYDKLVSERCVCDVSSVVCVCVCSVMCVWCVCVFVIVFLGSWGMCGALRVARCARCALFVCV
jgi:hypothetical protein